VLIFRWSIGELVQPSPAIDFDARKVRDVQSRFNVSDEVARAVVANKAWVKRLS
jgi:hypothetical protein